MTIGSRIQALRKERGMSQEELANKLSVSRQTVSQWETGQTAPSIDNIYTLKDIFGVSFDALMSEQQTESPQKAPAAVIPHKHGEITYNPEDIKSATRIVFMPRILRTLFVAVLFTIVLSASVIGDDRIDIPGFCIAALIFTIAVLIKQIIGAASYKRVPCKKCRQKIRIRSLCGQNGNNRHAPWRAFEPICRTLRRCVKDSRKSDACSVYPWGKFIHPAQIGAAVRCGQAVYRRGENTVAASGKGKVISLLLIILSILCPFSRLPPLKPQFRMFRQASLWAKP